MECYCDFHKYSIEAFIEETDVSEFDLIKKITYAKTWIVLSQRPQQTQNCQQSHHLSLSKYYIRNLT